MTRTLEQTCTPTVRGSYLGADGVERAPEAHVRYLLRCAARWEEQAAMHRPQLGDPERNAHADGCLHEAARVRSKALKLAAAHGVEVPA